MLQAVSTSNQNLQDWATMGGAVTMRVQGTREIGEAAYAWIDTLHVSFQSMMFAQTSAYST